MLAMPSRLVVKVTSGAEALERCTQAFTVSSVALASGVPTSLWLTGEASWLAVPGRAEQLVLPHSAPLAELRDAVLDSGTLTLCTQCAARRQLGADDVLPGVRLAGAALFVAEALEDGAQALVY
jgi:predicted peroxiredoxin